MRENALKDCISTAPFMFASSFNKEAMKKSFVDSGMLDERTNSCPDLNGLIRSFKIDWTKVEGGAELVNYLTPLSCFSDVCTWQST